LRRWRGANRARRLSLNFFVATLWGGLLPGGSPRTNGQEGQSECRPRFLFFSEAVNARHTLGIALSLAGVLTLISQGNPSTLLRLDFSAGDPWMFAAVVSSAIYAALLRCRPRVHGLCFLTATFVLGASVLTPFYVIETLSECPLPLAMNSALSISYAALFAPVLAHFSVNRVVTLLEAQTCHRAAVAERSGMLLEAEDI
jgi:drug/metabolite transporter (DMT)-like permease